MSVETITLSGQVVSRKLSKVERMVATRKAGLEITENGVDSLELGDKLGIPYGQHRRMMAPARFGDSPKACQSVREHGNLRSKMVFRPHGNRLESEARHRGQLDPLRHPILVERESGNEGNLFLRAASDHAATEFATEVGIIYLDFSLKQIALFTLTSSLERVANKSKNLHRDNLNP